MIKRIKISDFKSIRELDLEFGPVTVLVGRVGTGKSNLVQAIRFLRNLLLNFEQAVTYEFGWERIVPVGEHRPKTSMEVWFTIPGTDDEFSYRVGFGTLPPQQYPAPIRLMEEKLAVGKEPVFARERMANGQWEWKKVPSVSPNPSPHEDRVMLGQFPSLQKVVFANAALSTGIGYYHFPATALARESTSQRGQELFRSIPGLSDDAANYLSVVRGITQDFHKPNIRKSLLASLRAVNPSIESVELDSLVNPQRAIVGHKAADHIFELALEQESDGLRRFYAHLLALYQTPPKLTLVFEEPENAIFPGALSLLADEFKAAPRENRGQVILTTHNPLLLDCFDVDDVRAVEMRNGQTVVGSVSKELSQAVKDRLLSTGELLTDDRVRLDEEAKVPQPA